MKKNLSIAFILIFVFFIGSFLFYWYQIRPAQIKHACSWVKKHSDAIPARPAISKQELEAKGIIRTCKAEFDLVRKTISTSMYDIDTNTSHGYNPFEAALVLPPEQQHIIWDATSCREDGDRVIAEYKSPRKAVPAKDWYEAASKGEYTFCLHDKGL